MTFIEIARRWTIAVLAETLKLSASAIETVLPFQPRWLAQIALLASQLRAAADGDDDWDQEYDNEADAHSESGLADGLPDMDALLASHTCLRRGLSDIVARGLALDEDLLQRMRSDWTLESAVGFLSSADKTVRDTANSTLDEAAGFLGISVEAMATITDDEPVAAKSKQFNQKPMANVVVTSAQPSGRAR